MAYRSFAVKLIGFLSLISTQAVSEELVELKLLLEVTRHG